MQPIWDTEDVYRSNVNRSRMKDCRKLSKPDGYSNHVRNAIALKIAATTTPMKFGEHEEIIWESEPCRQYHGIGKYRVTEWPIASDQVAWWRNSGEVREESDVAVRIWVTVGEGDAGTIHLHSLNVPVGCVFYRKESEVQVGIAEDVLVDWIVITGVFTQTDFQWNWPKCSKGFQHIWKFMNMATKHGNYRDEYKQRRI